jgi:hypothetical protein
VAANFKLPLGLAGLLVLRASFAPDGWNSFARRATPMMLGLAAPFVASGTFLWWRGGLQEFLLSQFVVGPKYAAYWRSTMTFPCFYENIAWQNNLPLLALLGFGACCIALRWPARRDRTWKDDALYLWLAAALLVAFAHGSFLLYHLHSLAAPLVLLSAGRMSSMLSGFRQRPVLQRMAVAGTLFVVLAVPAMQARRNIRLAAEFRPERFASDDWLRLGQSLRDSTTAEDRIAVWGNAPVLYLYAERKSATRFIYSIFLADTFSELGFKSVFLEEFQRSRPTYFVLIKPQQKRPCAAATLNDEFASFESFGELRAIVEREYVLEHEDARAYIYRRADAPPPAHSAICCPSRSEAVVSPARISDICGEPQPAP